MHRDRRLDIAILVILFATGSLVRSRAAETPARPEVGKQRRGVPSATVSDDWKPLHDRWVAATGDLKIPAVSMCAVQNGKVVLVDAIGIRDPETGSPVTIDSPFYIASSTKSFTAMAVAILVDEGKINLDDPVKKYLPRFEIADKKITESMTIRDLLAHRQGIDSGPIATCEAYTGLIDDDRYYRLLAHVMPRPRFRYSNLNFTLAGRVIEAVSGQTWKQFIADRILKPAGMRHSYCQATSLYADPGAALPMVYTNGPWSVAKTVKVDSTMHAAGGMGASAADLAQWLILNLNGGNIDGHRIVSEQLAREMQSQQIKIPVSVEPANYFKDDGYGLGWFLGKYRDLDAVYHFGGYVGARCHISFIPAKGVGVAVLMNTSGPTAGFADVVAADLYDKLLALEPIDHLEGVKTIVAKVQARVPTRPPLEDKPPAVGAGLSKPVDAYLGKYHHPDLGALDVSSSNDRLEIALGAHQPTLQSTAEDEFRSNLLPGEIYKCNFELDDQGRVVALVAKDTLSKLRLVRQ